MNKTHTGKLLAFLLAVVFMFTLVPQVFAEGGEDALNYDPPLVSLANVKLEIKENGNWTSDFSNVPKNADFRIHYEFAVNNYGDETGRELQAGDYIELTLPNELIAIMKLKDQDHVIMSDGDPSYKIAEWSLGVDGKIRIVFDSDGFSQDNPYGPKFDNFYFELLAGFDGDKIVDGDVIVFDITAETEVTLNFSGQPPKASIKKSGQYDASKNEIKWTIKVSSGANNLTIKDVVVLETLDEKQAFLRAVDAQNKEVSSTDSSGIMKFELGDITGDYTFYVYTEPKDLAFDDTAEGKTSLVENTVDLYERVDNQEKLLGTDKKSVTITTDWIQKKGASKLRDDGSQYILWTITLNNNLRTIPAGATVTDIIPQYLNLVTDSIKRDGVSVPAQADGINEYYTYDSTGKKLTITIGEAIEGKTSVVTFETNVDDAYFKQQSQGSFANKAVLNWHDSSSSNGYDQASDGVGVGTSLLNKTGAGYDASTQMITWSLTVNANKITIQNAKIVDQITDGNQKFNAVYGVKKDGSSLAKITEIIDGEIYTNSYHFDETTKTLTIFLGTLNENDSPPVITFQTQVINPEHYATNQSGDTVYYNKATLYGSNIVSSESTGSQEILSEVLRKEIDQDSGYDYKDRIFTWEIIVNANKMVMKDVVVTDTIPSGHDYVSGSLTIDGNSVDATAITYKKDTDAGIETLTIKLDDFLSGVGLEIEPVKIEFKTKVSDPSIFLENEHITFKNQASIAFKTESEKFSRESVSAEFEVINQLLDKKALQYTNGNDYLSWKIIINSNGAPMAGAELLDQLPTGLVLDEESIELYRLELNSTGTTLGAKVTSVSFYTYDVESRSLVITPPDVTIADPHGYELRFDTYLTKGGVFENTIKLTGQSYSGTSTGTSGNVDWQEVLSGGSGSSGSITIVKRDSEDASKFLSGAVFSLWTKDKKAFLREGTTNGNGVLEFKGLRLERTYVISEVSAPFGYKVDGEDQSVFLTAAPQANGEVSKDVMREITNTLLRANVSILKVNPDGKGIEGGLFGIYDLDDVYFNAPLDTAAADEYGVITFENMLPGTYNIREINPPPGFLLTEEVVREVTLRLGEGGNTIEPLDLSEEIQLENQFAGKITIKKTGASGPLKGVTFQLLQKPEGSTEPTQVIESKTTGDTGIVEFTGLPLGTYYVRETAAPSQYYLPGTLHEFVLTGEQTDNIVGWHKEKEIRNYLLTDSIILTKTDSKGVALDGGWFGLYTNSAATGEPMDKVQADGGQVVFTGILPGTYYVREIEAPAGYIKSDDIIKVYVSLAGTNGIVGEVVKEPLINDWAGVITLVKTGEAGKVLPGAVFELLDANKKVIKEVVTGKDGKVTVSSLPMGTYYLREKTAPEGYALDETLIEVVLKAGAATDMTKTVTVENKLLGASVTVKKVNQHGDPLSGGLFGIYADDDDHFKSPLQKVAAKDGLIVFEGLQPGVYFVREIEAPKDYELTDQAIRVVLELDAAGVLKDVEAKEALVNTSTKTEGDDDDKDDDKDDDLVSTGGFLDTAMLWFFGVLLILAGAIMLLRMRASLVRK